MTGAVIAVVRDVDAEAVMGARGAAGVRFGRTPGYSVATLADAVGWLMRDPRRAWTAQDLADAVGCGRSTAWLICTDLVAVGHVSRRVKRTGLLMLHRLTESGIETYRPPVGGPTGDRTDGSVS